MSRSDVSAPARRPARALLAALLLAVPVLCVAAPEAGAVAVINTEVAEEMANDYAEAACNQDKPDCRWGWGAHCRQQGKFQVTCRAEEEYEIEPSAGIRELWTCERPVRYTAEKRAYRKHNKYVGHHRFLGPWVCGKHDRVRDY